MGAACHKKPPKKQDPVVINPPPANKKFGIDGPPSLRTGVIEMDFYEMRTVEEIVNTFIGSNFHFFLRKNHNFKPALDKVRPEKDSNIITASRIIFEHSAKEENSRDSYGASFDLLLDIFKIVKEELLPLVRRYETECPDDKLNRSTMMMSLQVASNTHQILQYMKSQTRGSDSEKWWIYLSKNKNSNHTEVLKEEYNELAPLLKKDIPTDGGSVIKSRLSGGSNIKSKNGSIQAQKDGEIFVQKLFSDNSNSEEYEQRFNQRMDDDLLEMQILDAEDKNDAVKYNMKPLKSK
jgi:hypothetical protein